MSLPGNRITGNGTSITENDLWLLSFYRSSEINGALFFGRIARTIRGPLQIDVTHHFSDEANHANWWTQCIDGLDHLPIKLGRSYQDRYLDAIGVPANLMEVMAITQVFEKRVIAQYRQHLRMPATHPAVRETIEKIMIDERWHVAYVNQALKEMGDKYGADRISETLARFDAADKDIYAETLAEYGERAEFLAEQSEIRSQR
ncbi:ferritin-like domain-containing protein [Nocardia stercoris]|uniref:Ferritin-like domain-containing protein n=1 Tax=Nocardia stercoris TaxID=2483361 RepID=A0A3M2KW51_9NOCA|nr:ferritin-like domain-containing protein [Nocardia stercoris]RMI29441.1 ferritin-like domain-containing protein [Nocardia stercoris]